MHHTLRQAIAFTTRPWRRPFYVYAYTCCYCCVQLSPLVSSSSSSSSIHDVVLLRQQQRQQQHYQTSAARTTARQPTTFNFHNRHLRCHGDHGELAALLPRREGGEASRAVSVCLRMHRSLFVSAPTAGAEATIRKTTSAAAAVHRLASNDWMGTTVTTSSGTTTMTLLDGSGIGGVGIRRGFAGGARWRNTAGSSGRRGRPLGMGKGLERKKAKKEEAKSQGKGGAAAAATAASSSPKLGPEPVLANLEDADGFLAALEYYRRAKAPRRVFQVFEAAQKKGAEGSSGELAAAAVKEELKLSREDLAQKVIETIGYYCAHMASKGLQRLTDELESFSSLALFNAKCMQSMTSWPALVVKYWRRLEHRAEQWETWLRGNAGGAQAVVRCACAASVPWLAEDVMIKAGLSCENLPEEGLTPEAQEASASVYPNLVTAYSRKDRRSDAMRLLESMAKARIPVKISSCNRLLQGFHKRRDLEAVFKVLDVLAAAGVEGDEETYEWLANAAVKGVDFVTGAVSMATLPKDPVLPEAAFIGRSNVGKSSLINMVCNRKNMAFTSKRPGKTQQFNYFVVNNQTENAFYLVDMPGMGYAKVPEKQRVEWASVFRSYITRRLSLRVVFHLIDGRHGPVGQDHEIMKLMADMPDTARYVVVLTKADKSANSVSKTVLQSVVGALRDAGVSRTPVVLTSATSKLGRDGMWRYLRLAALDKVLRENVVANLEEEGACPDDGAKIRNSLHWRDSRRDRGVGESSGTDGKLQPVGAAPSIGEN